MKITTITTRRLPDTVLNLELTDIEAGFLRCILGSYRRDFGFGRDLFNVLSEYHFPEYEKRYPKWRDEVE